MIEESGKRRRSRIELGYYRVPDGFARWRGRLCVIAILTAAGWLVASAMANRNAASHAWSLEPSRLASKGPLAQPHALWDSKCDACHASFAPINRSRWSPSPWGASHAGSTKCTTCHAGPPHHQSQRLADVPDCAECHRDHRGRDASLIAMDDSLCTSCHKNLSDHRDPLAGPMAVAGSVTRFDPERHPDLTASWTARSTDPRRIKFNHALHTAAGLTLEKGGTPLTFAQLGDSDRARYGWKDQEPLNRSVQLECASCHESSAAESPRSTSPRSPRTGEPRSPGAYMLPIVYEHHCAACHTLHFDAKLPGRQARHGIPARELLADLEQHYTSEAVKADPDLLRQFVPPRPIPGQPESPENPVMKEAVEDRVLSAMKILFGAALDENVRLQAKLPAGRRGCVECHVLKPTSGPIAGAASLRTLEIEPPLMTPVWQESASFNHTTHRALGCTECHPGAITSQQNGDRPMLPGIARCSVCHVPAGDLFADPHGAAKATCTECHRYHNGDHPKQGPGASSRRASVEQTLEQFLNGDQSLPLQ